MTSWLIDTNCLVSFVTDRNPSQRALVRRWLAEAAGLSRQLVVLSHVIGEFVYALQTVHGASRHTVAQMVGDLLRQPGVEHSARFEIDTLLELWPEQVKGYGDAAIAAVARVTGMPILTFDRIFCRQIARLDIAYEAL